MNRKREITATVVLLQVLQTPKTSFSHAIGCRRSCTPPKRPKIRRRRGLNRDMHDSDFFFSKLTRHRREAQQAARFFSCLPQRSTCDLFRVCSFPVLPSELVRGNEPLGQEQKKVKMRSGSASQITTGTVRWRLTCPRSSDVHHSTRLFRFCVFCMRRKTMAISEATFCLSVCLRQRHLVLDLCSLG